MLVASIPYKFGALPWAGAAASGYVTNPLPVTVSATGTSAAQNLGFPTLTAQPTGSGGTPPAIADFNGVLQYATAWNQWQQVGGPIFYDATLSAAINGYPAGAQLRGSAALDKTWISEVDNNTSDPDTGGAGWFDPFAATLASSGHQRIAGGLVIQWLIVSAPSQAVTTFNFPVAFPNACFVVVGSFGTAGISLTSNSLGLGCSVLSTTQFQIAVATPTPGANQGVQVVAIGY